MGSSPKKPWASISRPAAKKAAPGSGAGAAEPVAEPEAGNTLSPYQRGDPIPRADTVEKDTDTSWALWSNLAASENRGFADTAPPTDTMKFSAEERSYAATVPAALQAAAPKAPGRRELSIVEAMVEARRNNRVCPQPARWQQLYDMLPGKKNSSAGWEPPPPLIDAAWQGTPSIPKRMCFREHIEWAATHDCLRQVFTFMKSLPESEWHHMGE